jgi:hypothetical protein
MSAFRNHQNGCPALDLLADDAPLFERKDHDAP